MGDTNKSGTDSGSGSSISMLLDQLSGSEAWQRAIAAPAAPAPATTATTTTSGKLPTDGTGTDALTLDRLEDGTSGPLHVAAVAAAASTKRVSELLALLGSTTGPEGNSNDGGGGGNIGSSVSQVHAVDRSGGKERPGITTPLDGDNDEGGRLSTSSTLQRGEGGREGGELSFAEALAEVTRLAKNPSILTHLREIKAEQHRLERKYWEARQQILRNQEKQVKELKTRAAFTGPLGQREIERLTLQFQKELRGLEKDEFLPAYDRILSRQQATLQRIGIPWMFQTEDETERKRQQQLMTVIEGLLE